MANPGKNTYNCVSQEQDEISLFLQQILLRSSASSSSPTPQFDSFPNPGLPKNRSFPGQGSGSESRSTDVNWGLESDEHDRESEGAGEITVEEAAKPIIPARSSSKRSRAAEVHNLSEKRRRSKINEKMKALQNLIPNSNKTDKASMLDEAIEYLKHLQLQVQMLTLSHYPVCYSPHMKINVSEQQALNGSISMNQSILSPESNKFRLQPSETILSESPFKSSQDICLEGVLQFDHPFPEDRLTKGKGATTLWPDDTMVKKEFEAEPTSIAWSEHMLSSFDNAPYSNLS